MVGDVAAVSGEQPDVGGNHAVAASADDSVVVSRVVTEGEEGCWHACNSFSVMPEGLGIECKGVLSTGVDRMLVGNRVSVGLTRSTIRTFAPI